MTSNSFFWTNMLRMKSNRQNMLPFCLVQQFLVLYVQLGLLPGVQHAALLPTQGWAIRPPSTSQNVEFLEKLSFLLLCLLAFPSALGVLNNWKKWWQRNSVVHFWNRSGTVLEPFLLRKSHTRREATALFPHVLSIVGTGQWSNQCLTTNLPTCTAQLWELLALLLLSICYLLYQRQSSHKHVCATKMHSDIVARVCTVGQWLLIQSQAVSNKWRSVTSDLPPMM